MNRIWKKAIAPLLLIFSLTLGTSAFAEESHGTYRLTVNTQQNIVTVYEKTASGETAVKAFICSVGTGTPQGTFYTSDQYRWRPLFGDVYGQYATRITGHILFHSVPYTSQREDTLEYEEYNKLGTTASAGCIRLTAEDAKWIYDNCPSNTQVTIFASTDPEPITPAAPVKIDGNDDRRGWDPTDPNPDNPWKETENNETPTQGDSSVNSTLSAVQAADRTTGGGLQLLKSILIRILLLG